MEQCDLKSLGGNTGKGSSTDPKEKTKPISQCNTKAKDEKIKCEKQPIISSLDMLGCGALTK